MPNVQTAFTLARALVEAQTGATFHGPVLSIKPGFDYEITILHGRHAYVVDLSIRSDLALLDTQQEYNDFAYALLMGHIEALEDD